VQALAWSSFGTDHLSYSTILFQAAIVNAAPNRLKVARYLDRNTAEISDNGQTSSLHTGDRFGNWSLMAIDVTHVFTVSRIQLLPLDRAGFLRPLGRTLTSGWQILNITTLLSGPPFTVYSGVSKRVPGATDRPDGVTTPHFSTRRAARSDYFGRGDDNNSFFSIPINLTDGTGPNHGHFGTLGPLHVPRAWLSQLRHRTDQRHVPCADFGGGRTCPQSSLLTLRFYPFK